MITGGKMAALVDERDVRQETTLDDRLELTLELVRDHNERKKEVKEEVKEIVGKFFTNEIGYLLIDGWNKHNTYSTEQLVERASNLAYDVGGPRLQRKFYEKVSPCQVAYSNGS
jgi:hypothetical protein